MEKTYFILITSIEEHKDKLNSIQCLQNKINDVIEYCKLATMNLKEKNLGIIL